MDTTTFDKYLQEFHAKDYHGTDDDMPDSFDYWVGNMQPDTMMQLAEQFGAELNEKLKRSVFAGMEAVAELRKIKEMVEIN